MKLRRICIYPKDIQGITGRSERYGRKLIKEIKDHFGKASHQFVTTREFSEYTGINHDIVETYIQQTS